MKTELSARQYLILRAERQAYELVETLARIERDTPVIDEPLLQAAARARDLAVDTQDAIRALQS